MGKNVFAVPGPINSSTSTGTNELIKNGRAKLVTTATDIIGGKSLIDNKKSDIKLVGIEGEIFRLLENEPLDADEIAIQINKNVVEVGTTLSVMGIKGFVIESGGKFYLQK
jgi:DNA processing protein